MQVGIIAEGPADIAVLRNILKGKLGLERKDVLPIRPELAEDETDLGAPGGRVGPWARGKEGFSNWLMVLEECRERTKLEAFLESPIAEDRFVVVHIDTAEAHLKGYDVVRPNDRKAATYTDQLRALVVSKINALVGDVLAVLVRHAVAVEETDAWVLTLHDDEDKRDTGVRLDPKKRNRSLQLFMVSIDILPFVALRLDMLLTQQLFQAILTVALVALVVVFQEEIRRPGGRGERGAHAAHAATPLPAPPAPPAPEEAPAAAVRRACGCAPSERQAGARARIARNHHQRAWRGLDVMVRPSKAHHTNRRKIR